jgi:hypothetical protein
MTKLCFSLPQNEKQRKEFPYAISSNYSNRSGRRDVYRHWRLSLLAHYYILSGIKSKTIGDGQHGTARFATESEIKRTYNPCTL